MARQKLACSLSCFSAELIGLVQHQNIRYTSYLNVRDLLQHRYQNIRRLVDSFISKILNFSNVAGAKYRLQVDFLIHLLMVTESPERQRAGISVQRIDDGVETEPKATSRQQCGLVHPTFGERARGHLDLETPIICSIEIGNQLYGVQLSEDSMCSPQNSPPLSPLWNHVVVWTPPPVGKWTLCSCL
ncbi:hypothetical protein EVAR_4971_1 [Eumeta japonica]|uniref:Uncharacterized protein n=1 Tax=Eumeta variegata TaxID=151549 RepID=A0A4C1UZ49_EUMVA|nr:hypothetical protein EVAR_4971_1 [Eumeta japonica]